MINPWIQDVLINHHHDNKYHEHVTCILPLSFTFFLNAEYLCSPYLYRWPFYLPLGYTSNKTNEASS